MNMNMNQYSTDHRARRLYFSLLIAAVYRVFCDPYTLM